MKYTITRQFSIKSEKYDIISGSKTVCTAKATSSKEYKGQYNVKLINISSKSDEDEFCVVEPDPNTPQTYIIYTENADSNKRNSFGRLSYELCGYNNYLYTLVIGRKLYQVRSCDLKNRCLAIIDILEQNNSAKRDQYSTLQCPETLFQVIDSFSKSNKTYHVTINDKEVQLGYLAIAILLDLHECKRL